ncbi:MAG: hypothetical protein NC331_08345 [Lachnospiraceae bacterium]|nr:hypothetical protein [Lachnospiraceae bacterium]MCM1239381.1 hypothetical protein [Lachnospiraceae bacterium]
MDNTAKQAWKYIRTLNYYARAWKMPLEDLIYGLLDDMKEKGSYDDRQQFIDGIRRLKFRKWLAGYIEISQVPEEKIVLDNVRMNIFFRIWFWIPYKWGGGNTEDDINSRTLKETEAKPDKIQLCANIATIITAVIAIIEFIRV